LIDIYKNIYSKNTNKEAQLILNFEFPERYPSTFNEAKQSMKQFMPGTIKNYIDKIFNTKGNTGFIYFSSFFKDEIKTLCDSNIKSKAVFINFSDDDIKTCSKNKEILVINNNYSYLKKFTYENIDKILNDNEQSIIQFYQGNSK